MVRIDLNKCTECGICIRRFQGYCISEKNKKPVIDYELCNICQKCVAICPQRAFSVNEKAPIKMDTKSGLDWSVYIDFIKKRRSIKSFQNKPLDRKLISKVVEAANYAPNQNKNISLLIIDNPKIINEIDRMVFEFVYRIYRFFFKPRLMRSFIGLFSRNIDILKRKMDYDLIYRKKILKDNTQCIILLLGNVNVPITAESGHYLLANMIHASHSLGLGSCLMDSVKIGVNGSRKLRKYLGIERKLRVLGTLHLGYSAEKIINVPVGYEVPVYWNGADINS